MAIEKARRANVRFTCIPAFGFPDEEPVYFSVYYSIR